MKPLVENRYAKVRRLLDDLEFKEAFGIESLPLVEKLVTEIRQGRSSLKLRDKEFYYFKNVAEELEEGVLPFRNENQRLAKENSLLRLAVLRAQEDAHDKVEESKSRLRDLETENGDLKLLIKEFVSRVDKLNLDVLEKTRKIAELQARNLEAVISVSDGVKKMGGQKQRMEIDKCVPIPTLNPQAVKLRNFAKFGKDCNQKVTTDYLKIADSRIEALQIQNRELKLAQKDLLELVGCMKGKVDSREEEIEKLKFYFERNGPIPKNGTFGEDAEQTIKMLELQLEMLQRRNIALEGKLKSSLLDEHDKFMKGVESTAGEREYLAAILGLEGEEISLEDMLRYQEKIHILESRLAQCCKEKAQMKSLLNAAGLDCNDPFQTTSKTKGGLRKVSSQTKQDRPVRDTDDFQANKRSSSSGQRGNNSMGQILNDGFQSDMLDDYPEKIERRITIGNTKRNSQPDRTQPPKGTRCHSGGEINPQRSNSLSNNNRKNPSFSKLPGSGNNGGSNKLPKSSSKDALVYQGESSQLNEYSNTEVIPIQSASFVQVYKNENSEIDANQSVQSVDLQRAKSSGIFIKHHDQANAEHFGYESPIKRGSVEEPSRFKPSLEEDRERPGRKTRNERRKGDNMRIEKSKSTIGEGEKLMSSFTGGQRNNKLDYQLNEGKGNLEHERRGNGKGRNAQPISTPANSVSARGNETTDEDSDFEEINTLDRIHDTLDDSKDQDDPRFSQDEDDYIDLDQSRGNNEKERKNDGRAPRGSQMSKGQKDSDDGNKDPTTIFQRQGPKHSFEKNRENSQEDQRRKSSNRRKPRDEEYENEDPRQSQRPNSQNRRNASKRRVDDDSNSSNPRGKFKSSFEDRPPTDRDFEGQMPSHKVNSDTRYGELRRATSYLNKQERESADQFFREQEFLDDRRKSKEAKEKQNDSRGKQHDEQNEGLENSGDESVIDPGSDYDQEPLGSQKGEDGQRKPRNSHYESRKKLRNSYDYESQDPQDQMGKKSNSRNPRRSQDEEPMDKRGQRPSAKSKDAKIDNVETNDRDKTRKPSNEGRKPTLGKDQGEKNEARRKKNSEDDKRPKGAYEDRREKGDKKTLGSIEEMRWEGNEDRGRDSGKGRKSPSTSIRANSNESKDVRAGTAKKKTSFDLQARFPGENEEGRQNKAKKIKTGSSIMEMMEDGEEEPSNDEDEMKYTENRGRTNKRHSSQEEDEEEEYEEEDGARPSLRGGSRGKSEGSSPKPCGSNKHRRELEEGESKFVYAVARIDQDIQLSSFPPKTKGKETANHGSEEGAETSLEQYLIEAGAVRNKEMQEKENYELHRKLRLLRGREEGLVRENEGLKSAVKKLDRELDACRLELDMKDERLARLNKDKETQLEEVSRLQLKLRNSQLNLGHSGESSRENEREMGLLRRQLDNMRKDMEKVLNERDEALRDMRRISSSQNMEKAEKREMSADLNKKRKEVDELKKQVQKYIDEVREAEDLLRQKDEELEKILEQYRSLTGLDEQRSTLEREATSIRHDVREAFDENMSLKNKLASMSTLVKNYEEEIAKSSQRIIHLENQIGKIGEDEKMFKLENKSNRDLIITMERKMDKLRQDLGTLESTKNKLLAENTDLRTQLEMHTKQLNLERESRSHLEDEIKTSKEHEIEIQRKHKELSRERTDLLSRIDLLDNRCESLNDEVRSYRLKTIEQQSEHERLLRQLEQEKAERETTRMKSQLHSPSTNLLLGSTLDRSGRSPSPMSTHLAPRAQASSSFTISHQSRSSHSPSPPSDFNISFPFNSSTSRDERSS